MLILLRALQFRQFLLVPEVAMAIVCQQNQSRAARLTARLSKVANFDAAASRRVRTTPTGRCGPPRGQSF